MWFKNLRADIAAAKRNDPAARNKFEIFLTYSGVHALSHHRFAKFLYRIHLKLLARIVSQVSKFFTGIEIHPAANIYPGVFIDHGCGVGRRRHFAGDAGDGARRCGYPGADRAVFLAFFNSGSFRPEPESRRTWHSAGLT